MSTDLIVLDQKLPIININFDEVEKELQRLLTFYQGLAVTEETIKEAKEVQKKLAKLGKEINQRKIEIKKEMSAPITAFEERCKRLIAMVDEVNAPIKEGLQVFEDKRREEKADQVNQYIQLKIANAGLLPKYARLLTVDEKYLNVTTTMKSVKEDIDAKVETLEKAQTEAARAQETIAAHIQQMNDLLDLANPIVPEEFSWIHDEDLDLTGTLAEITRRAKDRKAAEEAAVERQKAKEAEAFNIPPEQLQSIDPDGSQFDNFVKMQTPQVLTPEQTAEALADFLLGDAPPPYIVTPVQGPTGLTPHTTIMDETHALQPSRPRLEELKRRSAEAASYTLTIKVSGAQLEDLENYLTDNLIQIIAKTQN